MKTIRFILLAGWLFVLMACSTENTVYLPDNDLFRYLGRIDFADPREPVLIGSASYVEFAFQGDSCVCFIKNMSSPENYNFISLEVDSEYRGRIRITEDKMTSVVIVPSTDLSVHQVRILKATEASNGTIAFGGVKTRRLDKLPELPVRKIEFIGNSITCGMGVDWKEIPCHTGQWYDQHNAYFAYGPQAAMDLRAQFMLSSVSGIGIYRNWNSPGPVMPEVYENLYLNTDSSKKWDFSGYQPDIVSICLGTNDFSDGDGSGERLVFDSATYINHYIRFVQTIYSHYPETQICLLNSPMVEGEKADVFKNCLRDVKNHFDRAEPQKKQIAVYSFQGPVPHGCDYHPDKDDQRNMADQLVPFYSEVMGW